ncbi:precorrin-6y C5,15-methyltransferase (decarboxylating) subunit CbiE [Aquabacter sp. L1I39]|uniref:precorrin-6y C5,15-methyltransferase (decarboxylating) subunit CbiE n=1 Tax=Aquabacter sp. L1I39 TaxID=2820278 RepID=UPI001ADBAFFC|nr:precorrin-6y C5,15-methyltransferase (decarboxylating) subunit CbiE [Aquabacter sp. L1I39]QTL05585.1 precorrin-6y C5,15-methyltransferase (decarboxylating) subunit CbiE [Aquabacter sp. L1I39]
MQPWLSLIGIGEDGLSGLTAASRAALDEADIVFGGPRHLALAGAGERGRPWPLPFSVAPVLEQRGRKVAVLASGDPFWFGVGGSLAAHLAPAEWRAFPALSTFSLIAARLGWRLEETTCLGLHAAPFSRLFPHLAEGARLICLVRDGAAVRALGAWLVEREFGESRAHLFAALGGPDEQVTACAAAGLADTKAGPLVAVALDLRGGRGPIRASGLPDEAFSHDGQITKRPVRALTLSTLAPRRGEHLWDIGSGSGSIAIEWLLATGPTGRALAIEPRADRRANIAANALAFGVEDRLQLVEGKAPEALAGLPVPHAVFVGGGASASLLEALWALLPAGTRLVANGVTLETEALLADWSARHGGTLLRIELAQAQPLGGMRGWTPARPIVQWSVVR